MSAHEASTNSTKCGAERVLLASDSYCPHCGHNRDASSVSSIDNEDGIHSCQMCGAMWRESPAERAEAALRGGVVVPEETMEHWIEYWNGQCNESAMSNALYFLIGEFRKSLAAAKEGQRNG